MIWDYLFIISHFTSFAEQAERVSHILHEQNSRYHAYEMTPIIDRSIQQYMQFRKDMAYKMQSYVKESQSLTGWIKSFIPGTKAFMSRNAIASQLMAAKACYLTIIIHYYQYHRTIIKPLPQRKNITQPCELKKEIKQPAAQPSRVFKHIRQDEKIQSAFSMWRRV